MAPKKSNKKKPNLEIERKFLLKRVPVFNKNKWTYLDIKQFYFDKNGERIRYRQATDENDKTVFYSTKKKFISKGTNEETEFEISKGTFWAAFKNEKNKRFIEKKRFIYKYKGLKFEIDKFINMNLVIMEIELKNINQKISFPQFIKKEIILEVTEIKELGNFNLSEKC